MRAKKNFIVVAYDVADDRRRSHVVKLLEKVGVRINFSVFECLLTDTQFTKLQYEISQKIKAKKDIVVYYPICIDCYTKIVYQPKQKRAFEKVSVVSNVKIFICENLFFKHSLIFNHLNRIEKMNIRRKVSQIFIFSFLIGTFAKKRKIACFGL